MQDKQDQHGPHTHICSAIPTILAQPEQAAASPVPDQEGGKRALLCVDVVTR